MQELQKQKQTNETTSARMLLHSKESYKQNPKRITYLTGGYKIYKVIQLKQTDLKMSRGSK